MGRTRRKKFVFVTIVILICSILSFIQTNFGYENIITSYASLSDIDYAIKNKTFGNFYSLSFSNQLQADNDNLIKVDLKFLNMITVKSFYVNTKDEFVYAGGNAVGVYLNTKGVILMGSNSIITKDGLVDTLKDSPLQVGDIILKINDELIYNIDNIIEIINREENRGKKVKISYLRKNKEF
ncbi:MAG: hypothetical protein ACI4TI_03140, partial [Christensenellales bacterium]